MSHPADHSDPDMDDLERFLEAARDQRDAAQAQVASLRAELARVKKERDALKAGKWAGPWEWRSGWSPNDHAARRSASGGAVVLAYHNGVFGGSFVHGESCSCARTRGSSIDEAKKAADAALIAAGWYLANEGGE